MAAAAEGGRAPKRPRLDSGRKMSTLQAAIWDKGFTEGRRQSDLDKLIQLRVAADEACIRAHSRTCIVCQEVKLCERKCIECATPLCVVCYTRMKTPCRYGVDQDDLDVSLSPPPSRKCPTCKMELEIMRESAARVFEDDEFFQLRCKHAGCGFEVVVPVHLDPATGERDKDRALREAREELVDHELLCPQARARMCPGVVHKDLIAHIKHCKTNPTCARMWRAIDAGRKLQLDVRDMENEEVARESEITRLEAVVSTLRAQLSEARGDTPAYDPGSPVDYLESPTSPGYSPTSPGYSPTTP